MRAALVLVIAAGCWSSPKVQQPEPPPPHSWPEPVLHTAHLHASHTVSRCATVVDHAFEISRDELKRIAPNGQLEALRNGIVESCETMQWTAEALDCFELARDSSELDPCARNLTQDQNDDLAKRIQNASSGTNP